MGKQIPCGNDRKKSKIKCGFPAGKTGKKNKSLLSLAAVVEGKHYQGSDADCNQERDEHQAVDEDKVDAARWLFSVAGMILVIHI
jgi:hypothetical protein